jgi:SAM-dependent methyltransferase
MLEAGTGAGIFLEWFSQFGAKHVFAMNLGLDAESAAIKAKSFPNVTVVEGDIFHLPFKNKLDFVISHGVVHHLPEPETGFQKLVSALKPRWEIFIWVYGKDPIVPVIELLRGLFHKMPKRLVQAICWFLAFPLLLSKIVFLTMNKIPFLRKYAAKVPYHQYAVRNYNEMQCTLMDKLFVPVVNYYDRPELEKWFSNAKLGAVTISQRDGNSWSCYGKKKE